MQTLPTPLPPPEPRADEPYVEVGRLQIRVGIDTVMLSGITLTTLDLGPGHWPGTAVPGQIGNVVVAGHRTSHNKVFRDIDQLQPGDEVIFTTVDGEFYRVSETTIVQPDAMYIIDQTREPTATLFAPRPGRRGGASWCTSTSTPRRARSRPPTTDASA
ncbi:MAG: sortase [Ilumatobacteraceae bacterium]